MAWEDSGEVVLVYRCRMPRPHRTRSFEVEASVSSHAPAADVMRRVRTPPTWPSWQSEIMAIRGPSYLADGDTVDGDARLLGFDAIGRSTVISARDERFEEDVIVGVRMRISYEVKPQGRGSIITHRMEADLPAGVAGRLLSMLLAWRLKKMQSTLLRSLGQPSQEPDQAEATRS